MVFNTRTLLNIDQIKGTNLEPNKVLMTDKFGNLIYSDIKLYTYFTTLNLFQGSNTIVHNLELLFPQYYTVNARLDNGHELTVFTDPLFDLTNSLVILSNLNLNNVRLIIQGVQ